MSHSEAVCTRGHSLAAVAARPSRQGPRLTSTALGLLGVAPSPPQRTLERRLRFEGSGRQVTVGSQQLWETGRHEGADTGRVMKSPPTQMGWIVSSEILRHLLGWRPSGERSLSDSFLGNAWHVAHLLTSPGTSVTSPPDPKHPA